MAARTGAPLPRSLGSATSIQPLYISYEDDTDGNEINDIRGNYCPSDHLYGVWDGGIIWVARKA